MSQPPFPQEWTDRAADATIIRDYGNYSLSFPCNPHDLRTTAIGFRLLFWADFLLVTAILIGAGTVYWFSAQSPQFQTFCESMTVERMEALQRLAPAEQQAILMKELPMEQLAIPAFLATFSLLAGLGLNVLGTLFCMSCPQQVLPKVYVYGLIWFGAFLLSGVIPFLGPLLFLIAWQFWLSYIFRLSILLGQRALVYGLRMIHRTVFWAIMAFLGTTLAPGLVGEGALGSFLTMAFSVSIFVFLVIGFLQYANALKTLRIAIRQMAHYWDYGKEDVKV